MSTEILHISDTHGSTPPLENIPIVIHTGDMLPNCDSDAASEQKFQINWLRQNTKRLKLWLQDRKFLFVPGNHDFIDPCPYLQSQGIDALNISDQTIDLEGVKIHGWAWMPGRDSTSVKLRDRPRVPTNMKDLVDDLAKIFNEGHADVLATHCPPYGMLDHSHNGKRFGNTVLADALNFGIFTRKPKIILCGHIHENAGIETFDEMVVSNAATIQRVIEL